MNDSDHNNTMMSVRQRNNRRRLMQELDILPPRPVLFPCFSSFNSSYAACCAKWSTSKPTSSTDIDRIGDVNKSNININITNSNSNSNINKDSISYFDLYPTLVEEEEEDSYSSITSTLPSGKNIDKKLTSSSSSPLPSTPITLPSSPCDTLESLNSTSTTTKEDNDDSNDAITFITGSPVSTTTTTTIIMSDDMRNDENENENEDDTNTNTNTTDDYFDCTMIDMPDMTPNISTTGIDFSRFSSSSSSSSRSRSRRASSPPKTIATTKSASYISKKDNNNNDRYRLLFLQTIAVEVFRILFSAVMVDNKRTKKRRKTKKSQAYKV
jgi:hypothetical protein